MKNVHCLIVIVLLLSSGFREINDELSKGLNSLSQDDGIFSDYMKNLMIDSVFNHNYVIIPSEIGPNCIENLISFIEKNNGYPLTYLAYKYVPTKIVLTGRSLNQLRLTFGEDLINYDNILLDTTNAWISTKISIKDHAEIFYTDKRKIVKRVSLDADNMEQSLVDLQAWEHASSTRKIYSGDPGHVLRLKTKATQIEAVTVAGHNVNLFSEEPTKKLYVLNFWVEGCAYCKVSMPIMNRIYEEYKNQDVEVISIYGGNLEELKKHFDNPKFSESSNQFINFPILANAQNIINNYGVIFFPATYVINHQGIISFISGFTQGRDETISIANGVAGENPYYYLILKGQIDQLLSE